MVPKNFAFVAFIALFCIAETRAQERKLDPLIVSYSSLTSNRASFWIANETGLYEKYGLDVKLVSIAAGSVSLTALLAGNVHLTTDSSSGVVSAVARGAPVVTVSTNGALPYQLIAVSSIKTPADLKVAGSSRIGAGTDFLPRRILWSKLMEWVNDDELNSDPSLAKKKTSTSARLHYGGPAYRGETDLRKQSSSKKGSTPTLSRRSDFHFVRSRQ